MEALLLAAGFGSRLGEITKCTPKCLVPVRGQPLLKIWLDHLILDIGIKRVYLNTHYLAHQVEDFVSEYTYRSSVVTLPEAELLDTAGTIRKNIAIFGGELLVIHADNYFTHTLMPFVSSPWIHSDCSIKALTIETATPSKFGIFDVSTDDRVVGFREKPAQSESKIANAAVFRMRNSCLQEIATNLGWANISRDVLPNMTASTEIFRYDGDIIDIGTPDDLAKVQ